MVVMAFDIADKLTMGAYKKITMNEKTKILSWQKIKHKNKEKINKPPRKRRMEKMRHNEHNKIMTESRTQSKNSRNLCLCGCMAARFRMANQTERKTIQILLSIHNSI